MRPLGLAALVILAACGGSDTGSDGDTGPNQPAILARRYTVTQQVQTSSGSLACTHNGTLVIESRSGAGFNGSLTAEGTCQTNDPFFEQDDEFEVGVADGTLSGNTIAFYLTDNTAEPRCHYTGSVSGSKMSGDIECPAGSGFSEAATGTWAADSIAPQ